MDKLFFPALALVGLAGCPAEGTSYTPLAPEVPRLRLPQNDAYQGNVHRADTLRPWFSWAATASTTEDPVVYELQVSSERTFDTPVIEERFEATSYQPPMALPVDLSPPVGLRYYWRVRACVRNSCSKYSKAWKVNLGRSIKDYNGDGDEDLLVGAPGLSNERAYIYFGGPGVVFDVAADATLTTPNGGSFGDTVASAGDVNGDGFADVLVGAWGERDFAGSVYLYLGGPGQFDTTPDKTFRASGRAFFGMSVAGIGDLNGDGLSDFAVGAPVANYNGLDAAGTVSIYLGSSINDFKIARVLSSTANDQLGRTLAPAGDMNGDGFSDLAVGALGDLNFGSVYVFLGGEEIDEEPDMKVPGNVSEDYIGAALVAEDFNQDGFSDLVVGVPAYGSTTKTGHVSLYEGGEILDRNADQVFAGVNVDDKIGYAVSAGDVNGDGRSDLVFSSLLQDAGSVSLFPGLGEAISMTHAGSLPGPAMARFGFSLTASSDLNGDGFDDLVIGSSIEHSEAGCVRVYFGSAGALFDGSLEGLINGLVAGGGLGTAIANP